MEKRQILLIEDEPTINRILSLYFKNAGFEVKSALDGKKGLELFDLNSFDLVCLDIMLPKINGWEIAKQIRGKSNIPMIMMSTLSQEDDILKGYSLQVDDYVTKPFQPAVLVAKIESLFKRIDMEHQFDEVLNIHGINFEFSSFKDSNTLEELLTVDELTKVSNRRFLDFYLEDSIKKANDFHVSFGVLFVDIDYFKNVNDTYGHQVGDIVLSEMASIIQKSLRTHDLIGRYGGEEFLIVVQVEEKKYLNLIAEKLRQKIEEHVFDEKNHKLHITVSIGGTMYRIGESSVSLVERADQNMYESKTKGRNQATIK